MDGSLRVPWTASALTRDLSGRTRPRPARRRWKSLALTAVLAGAVVADVAGQEGRPRVVVLSTGGTIASVYDEATGGFAPALTGEELVRAIPGLDTLARVQVEQVVNVPSTDMTPTLWHEVSRRANRLLADTDVAGVVVTHGTDTLEETAYWLDLTVTSHRPVVVVGAQRAASEPDADGPRNLRDAIRVAAAPEAAGMGTMVVMNGRIDAAREATKTHSLDVSTFRSLSWGALGTVDPDGVRFYRSPLRRQTIPVPDEAALARVDIVSTYAGADARLVRALMAGGLDGVVVEAAGVGNLASALFEGLEELRAAGIPCVVTSRVPDGRVLPLYSGRGGGVSLREIGCVFADNLSPQKARVLLIAALASGRDEELVDLFSR